jgi:hypothetical protein
MHHIHGQNPLSFDPNSMQLSSSIQHQQKPYNSTNLPGSMITDNNNFLASSHHHHQQQQQHLSSYNHHHHHHHQQQPTLQQYCPPPPPPSIQQQQQQFNNYHYMNTYSQDPSAVYNSDSQLHFSTHHFDAQPTYSSYDSNNNYGDQQQYGLLRPAMESEIYSSYYSTDLDQQQTSSSSSTANENLLHNLNNNNSTNTPHYTDLTSIANNSKHYDFIPTNDIDNHQKEDEQSILPSISNENNFHWNQTTCLATQW